MENTKQKTNVTGAGCSDNPGPAVGSTWCASQRSTLSNSCTTTGNARLNMETGLNGDKTIKDLNTIGPLVAENTGALDELFEEIRLAVVRCEYNSRDSDDDSSDSDSDEFRHRSPDVRFPEARKNYQQNTDEKSDLWSAFDERIDRSFSSSSSQSELLWSLDLEQSESERELSSDSESNYSASDRSLRPAIPNLELNRSTNYEEMWPSNKQNVSRSSDSDLWLSSSYSGVNRCPTDDERSLPSDLDQKQPSKSELSSKSHSKPKFTSVDKQLQPSTVKRTWLTDSALKLELHSELMRVTSSKNQLNQMWLSDSDIRTSSFSSNLMGSMDKDELCPSDLEQKWPSNTELRSASLSEPIVSDIDDEQILPFDEEQNMVSLPEQEEDITVVSTDVTECNDATEVRQPARRSFLSALGRRVLSAGRKLFCCGCTGRDYRKTGEKTKWKNSPGTSFNQDSVVTSEIPNRSTVS